MNKNARGGEVMNSSAKEEELACRCLFQEVALDRCFRQLGQWI